LTFIFELQSTYTRVYKLFLYLFQKTKLQDWQDIANNMIAYNILFNIYPPYEGTRGIYNWTMYPIRVQYIRKGCPLVDRDEQFAVGGPLQSKVSGQYAVSPLSLWQSLQISIQSPSTVTSVV